MGIKKMQVQMEEEEKKVEQESIEQETPVQVRVVD